jgi:hypothetical protein
LRSVRELLLLLACSGCLTFLVPPDCDESLCGGFACDNRGFCLESCDYDNDCAEPLRCQLGSCVAPCVDEDCPGFLKCDVSDLECLDECDNDYDCRNGRTCRRGDCVRE